MPTILTDQTVDLVVEDNGTISGIVSPAGPKTVVSLGGGSGSVAVQALTSSRALTSTDNGATLAYSDSADIVLTVPQGLGPQFKADLIQASAGRITISAAPEVTIDSLYGYSQTSGKGSAVTLISTGTNTFVLIGGGV